MRALIANRLDDGEVVFWNGGQWVRAFADAELFADDDPASLGPDTNLTASAPPPPNTTTAPHSGGWRRCLRSQMPGAS